MASFMPQACERCWKRKQKCDRKRPICGHCQTASKPCMERLMGATLDPGDPLAHHSYIESLKRRVQILQGQLDSPSPGRTGQHDASHEARQNNETPSQVHDDDDCGGDGGDDDAASGPRRHPPAQKQRDILQEEIGHLSLSAMAEHSRDQAARPLSISFATLFQAAISVSGGNVTRSDSASGALGDFHRGLLRQGVHLSPAQAEQPFEYFLNWCQHTLPFAPASQLREEYNEVMEIHAQGAAGALPNESTGKMIRVYVAVAMGILLCRDNMRLENYAAGLALTAYELMLRIITRDNELETVQCFIALIVHSMQNDFGGSAWHLLGLAVTRCLAAGMHSSRQLDPTSGNMGEKNSSRAFWTLYYLDARISSSLDRPYLFQDEEITATPPFNSPAATFQDPAEALHAWNIHQAKLAHDISRHPSHGVLFHFSNYRHWRDTAPVECDRIGSFQHHHCLQSSCRTLLLILQLIDITAANANDVSLPAEVAEAELTAYLTGLDDRATQTPAWGVFDGLDIFRLAVGLIFAATVQLYKPMPPTLRLSAGILSTARIGARLLAEISYKYRSVRNLAKILDQFVDMLALGNVDEDGCLSLDVSMQAADMSIPTSTSSMIHTTLQLVRSSMPSR